MLGVSPKMIRLLIREGKLLASNLSSRLTRIVKSSVVDMLEYTRVEAIKSESTTKSPEQVQPVALTRERCYSVTELTTMFGMDRQCLYTLLSRKQIPKIEYQKTVFYAKAEVDKLFRDRKKPRAAALDAIRKANQKDSGPLEIKYCYTIPELEVIFGKDRALLYSFFKRRAVPTLKVGTQVYLSKKAIRKLLNELKVA
ncbi:hypothetical protein KHS38_01405 [Mucilaginibacter sp. Bleaf8]|nr:hypothetical protein [Mucilaginibacter sp. Bleaf8]